MNLNNITYVYFIGIGGIGMSALARYFNFRGKKVSGYDRTPTVLTETLTVEGIDIHFEEQPVAVQERFAGVSKNELLVVYTPAVPKEHAELQYFQQNGYSVKKRSEVLGLISKDRKTIAIAGTHGKTSVTTTTAHLLTQSEVECSAFLGGISKNYETNFLYSDTSEFVVVEADEYDRSFHTLYPEITLITSMDADHLDIYGTHEAILESFEIFISQLNNGGTLIHKHGLPVNYGVLQDKDVTVFTYSAKDQSADYHAEDVKVVNGVFQFSIQTPKGKIEEVELLLPGWVNIENTIGAAAVSLAAGASAEEIKKAISSFAGVKRRFEYHVKNDSVVYIDDYAHHPEELRACITSIKEMYPEKKVTGIFQPHLYSRTKDFANDFAKSLSLLDSLLLLDIYAARELPIEGVHANMILDLVSIKDKKLISKETLLNELNSKQREVILTLGAGDIDVFANKIKDSLLAKV